MVITQPDARVLLHNYDARLGYKETDDVNSTYPDEIEDISDAVISIETSKSKSQPSGTFSIILAPTVNWVGKITPGSWLSIHMKNWPIADNELYTADCLKMVGRIDSVRCQVSVDQSSGARSTLFYVMGRDWGQVFESVFYMDVLATWSGDSSLASALKLGFNDKLIEAVKRGDLLPSPAVWLDFFIKLWGESNDSAGKTVRSTLEEAYKSTGSGILDPNRLMPKSAFTLPASLSEAFGYQRGTNLSNNIKIVKNKETESVGFPEMSSLVGGQPLWNILSGVANTIINEMVVDLKWEDTLATPTFTLYHRIKPFYLHDRVEASDQDTVLSEVGSPFRIGPNTEMIKSSFFGLERTDIHPDTIVSLDYGTNWLDRINFVELVGNGSPISLYLRDVAASIAKFTDGIAIYDPKAFAREGVKPMLMSSIFFPPKGKTGYPDPQAIAEWVPVVASWYFDTHKMLNGTIVLMGHDRYIGVGTNISFDSTLLLSKTSSGQDAGSFQQDASINVGEGVTKILAHVENVSYRFQVSPNGERSMMTTVAFVRGVTTTPDCSELKHPDEFGLSSLAHRMNIGDLEMTNIVKVREGSQS